MKKIQERRLRVIKEIRDYEKGRKINEKVKNKDDNFDQKDDQKIILFRKNHSINNLKYRVSVIRKKKSYEIICEPMNF